MTNAEETASMESAAGEKASGVGDDSRSAISPDPSFLGQVEEIGEERLTPCFQCVKCSGGCPLTFAMDVLPHQLVRMVQMGLKQEVLKSSTIWLCAGCETCSTRCPNGVSIAHLMDVLRQIALTEGVEPAEPEVAGFHTAFLDEIRAGGRLHEMGMVRRYKFRTRKWMKDAGLGWRMFSRGKLKLLPVRIRDREWLKKVIPRFRR